MGRVVEYKYTASAPPPVDQGLTDDERNAWAWLALTDPELIERSASLGLSPDLAPAHDPADPTAILATRAELIQLREAADAVAVEHAGKKYVASWIKEHRDTAEEADDDVVAY